MRLADRMNLSIARRQGTVILRSEFDKLGSKAQVNRVLARFVDERKLFRVSKGIFAKARINKFTGEPTPAGTLESIAAEIFQKLNIEVWPGKLAQEYSSGQSTQIPMQAIVNTGTKRISRKIIVGNRSVQYENNSRRA
jgi:hypothetical protein